MSHRALYWIVGGVLVALLAVMLFSFSYNRSNEQAVQKAEQLIAAFDKAGLRTSADPKVVAKVFGNDGGAVCAEAGEGGVARGIAKLNLAVGGNFYFRPVIADRRLATGLVLVVQTYCPDKLQDFQQFIDNQRFAKTTG